MQTVLDSSVSQLLSAAFATAFIGALVFFARSWIIARRRVSIKHEHAKSLANLNQTNAKQIANLREVLKTVYGMFSCLQVRATAAARAFPVIKERRNAFLSDLGTLNEFTLDNETDLPQDTLDTIKELQSLMADVANELDDSSSGQDLDLAFNKTTQSFNDAMQRFEDRIRSVSGESV